MGVMESLRSSTKYLFWLLLLSFGVLWMLSDTQFFDAIKSGPRSLGSVNGDAISFDEYNQRLQFYTQQYSQQTGGTLSPEIRANYESQVWDEMVNIRLLEQKMEELGIVVTDEEVVDLITGPNPSPLIRQIFADENGTIDRNRLNAAIESPESTNQWIQLENQIRQQRRQEKLNNYLTSGNVVSERDIQTEYVRANSSASLHFVRFPFANVDASEVSVSDAEIAAYYSANKEDYKRETSFRMSYVVFSKEATAKDTARTKTEITSIRSDFANAKNDSLFLARYQSQTAYNNAFVSLDDIRVEFKVVAELENGEVSEPIQIGDRFHLIKRIAKDGKDYKFANYSLQVIADAIETVDAMAEEADDFSFYAEEDGFKEEAERRNLEVFATSATSGNPSIVGVGNSRQLLNYLESSKVGEISTALELDRYFVIAQLDEITEAGFRPLEDVRSAIENKVGIDKRKEIAATRMNGVTGSTLDAYASSFELKVDSVANIQMSNTVLPGAGREPALIGKIFTLEAGQISKPIVGDNGVYVVMIDTKNMAIVDDLTGAATQSIRQRLSQQKSQTFFTSWLETIKEEAKIVDNRKLLLRNS
jgi:peptidyl-prolyl cis-trans isomerase D